MHLRARLREPKTPPPTGPPAFPFRAAAGAGMNTVESEEQERRRGRKPYRKPEIDTWAVDLESWPLAWPPPWFTEREVFDVCLGAPLNVLSEPLPPGADEVEPGKPPVVFRVLTGYGRPERRLVMPIKPKLRLGWKKKVKELREDYSTLLNAHRSRWRRAIKAACKAGMPAKERNRLYARLRTLEPPLTPDEILPEELRGFALKSEQAFRELREGGWFAESPPEPPRWLWALVEAFYSEAEESKVWENYAPGYQAWKAQVEQALKGARPGDRVRVPLRPEPRPDLPARDWVELILKERKPFEGAAHPDPGRPRTRKTLRLRWCYAECLRQHYVFGRPWKQAVSIAAEICGVDVDREESIYRELEIKCYVRLPHHK